MWRCDDTNKQREQRHPQHRLPISSHHKIITTVCYTFSSFSTCHRTLPREWNIDKESGFPLSFVAVRKGVMETKFNMKENGWDMLCGSKCGYVGGDKKDKPTMRIELMTFCLQNRCTTTVLRRQSIEIGWGVPRKGEYNASLFNFRLHLGLSRVELWQEESMVLPRLDQLTSAVVIPLTYPYDSRHKHTDLTSSWL